MRPKLLLIDADIPAYKVAATCQDSFDLPGGRCTALSPGRAKELADEAIAEICTQLKCNNVLLCFSDDRNWRKEYAPDYKTNRKPEEKPELLRMVKDYLAVEYPSKRLPRLEADDVLGIMATAGHNVVMVSEDKDLRTVPGRLYNPRRPELGIIRISKLDADRFHMWQTITGDATDGIPGCRGVGPSSVYAEEIVHATRAELWDIVLEAYASKGATEDEAIHNARLTHILHATEYSPESARVKLWNPLFLRL